MNGRRAVAGKGALLAVTLALAAPSPALAAGPQAGASAMGTYCGRTVDVGHTRARTYAIAVSCAYARGLFRSWLARPKAPNQPPPRVLFVRGFRCVFGGDAVTVKLDCYRGAQVVRGRWGD